MIINKQNKRTLTVQGHSFGRYILIVNDRYLMHVQVINFWNRSSLR